MTAVQNVASDTGVIWAGITLGASIGSTIDPIGALVGGLGGAHYAKKTWDKFKVGFFCKKEEAQLEKAIITYTKALKKKLLNNQKSLEKKAHKWKKTFGSAVYRRKVLKEEKITQELYLYIIKRMREEYRIKNKTFKTLSALEELGEDPRGGGQSQMEKSEGQEGGDG